MLRRRELLIGAAAAATGIPFAKLFAAPGGALRIRSGATTPAGQAMLKLYAEGVKTLQAKSASDPLSWVFQWYTHSVQVSTEPPEKRKEIARIFGQAPSPARTAAEMMWSTCQAHRATEPEANFLPWHRAYLMCFEAIIRSVTDEQFTLPYWDYTSDAAAPPQFRGGDDPLHRPLFVASRSAGVNAGRPIAGPELINLDAMKQPSYLPGPSGLPQGFNEALESTLHGYVHVYTGNQSNMGSVASAANDPIFWMHHCNIDRIWAGWNDSGGVNPTDARWKVQRYAFVTPSRELTRVSNDEVTSIEALGYRYDDLPKRPAAPATVDRRRFKTAASGAPPAAPLAAATLPRAVTLGAGATKVQLEPFSLPAVAAIVPREGVPREGVPSAAAPGTAGPSGATGIGKAPPRETYLVVSNIQTDVQPGVAYGVYATEGAKRSLIGSIQFFDAQSAGEANRRRFVFDITELASTIASEPLNFEIAPIGTPDPAAKPVVGSMSLIHP